MSKTTFKNEFSGAELSIEDNGIRVSGTYRADIGEAKIKTATFTGFIGDNGFGATLDENGNYNSSYGIPTDRAIEIYTIFEQIIYDIKERLNG